MTFPTIDITGIITGNLIALGIFWVWYTNEDIQELTSDAWDTFWSWIESGSFK